MHDRTTTARWKYVLALLGMMVAVFAPVVAATSTTTGAKSALTTETGVSAIKPTFSPTTYQRNVAWWPFTSGPYYGDVDNAWARPNNVIVTPVGTFTADRPLDIPAGLTKTLAGLSQGRSQYFLAQLRPDALNQAGWREALLSTGAEIVGEEPVNTLVLRMNRAAYDLVVNSPDFQYVGPYHSAYRLHPGIGTAPQLSAEAAARTTFNLGLQLFRGEPAEPLISALAQLGLAPTSVQSPEGGFAQLFLEGVRAEQIVRLAQLEPVAIVYETSPTVLHGGRGSLYLQTQPGSGTIADFTYWKVGLQGDGQIIQITDSGLSVDAGDHTNTKGVSGWTGTGGDAGPNVGGTHRKVKAYINANQFTGGAGNLLGCDTPTNGAFTHGQVVTAVALGGATRGFVPAPTNPNPTDDTLAWNPNRTWVDAFGGSGFWLDAVPQDGLFKEAQDSAYDGIAKGAKVVFVDGSSSCPEIANPGITPGNIQTTIQNTWLTHGASIHSYSFGSAAGASGPTYPGNAQNTDIAVSNYPVNVVIWSASNEGPVNNGNGSSLAFGNTSNDSCCKNCIGAGASFQVDGNMWDFQSEGPGPNKRHVVFVLAEGYDNSCRSDETSEDQTGAATCIDAGYQAGTSFSAPNLAGAAAVMREYFADGFYPDGSNTNPTNATDKVPWISSTLVRALMIAGAQGIGGVYGQVRFIPMHRMNHVWGWGQLFLSRALPVGQYATKTVSGLIVHDRPGDLNADGTVDGVSNLSLPNTIPTSVTTYTSDFQVLDTDEDLVVALTWLDNDTTTGTVTNHLDLVVRDCGADETCGNADDTIWNGGAFNEDYNEDGTLTELDIDGDGQLTGWWYSISNRDVTDAGGTYSNYKTTLDNHEGVFIAWRDSVQDLNGDGTADIRYLDDVNGDTGGGCTQDTPCPRTGKWQVSVTRVSGTNNTLQYAVAIAGPVAAGSSIRFDTNPVTCNGDEAIEVNETEDATDGSCLTPSNCPASVIGARSSVKVFNTSGVEVDSEAGLTFINNPAGTLRFESATRMPVSSLTLANGAVPNDGVLAAENGYTLKVYYNDVKSAATVQRISEAVVDCQPAIDVFVIRQLGPDTPFLLAGGCDDDRYLDRNESFSLQVQFFNTDPFELVNTTATLEAFDGDGTGTPSTFVAIDEPTKPVGALGSQNLQRTTFGFRVIGTPPARQRETFRLCIKSDPSGQGIGACTTFQFLMQADDEKHFYITDCPSGCTGVSFDRNNDEKIETLVSDNPYFDVMNHIHKNLAESVNYEAMNAAGTPCEGGGCGNVGFNGPWNFDTDNEGFRTGRDADSKKGSGAGTAPQPTNWGEDSNWNGTLEVGLNEDADGDVTLDQNWGIGGGCGWMTKGTGTTGGVWHTGTIGAWANVHRTTMCGGTTARENDSVCEQYDTELGSQGQNYWWESLRSPAIHPVRYDPTGLAAGGDGYGWKSRILDWAWNMQFDAADSEAHGTWEFDLDTADGQQTQLGDLFIQKNFGWESGLITGGQLDLYGGGYAFAGTCTQSGGCTTSDGANPNYLAGYGDEIWGIKGNSRSGKRGCYFNDLNRIASGTTTAAQRRVKTALDLDDDCDNEYSLGADGCPGGCGVDDDGNGQIDDAGEICPCTKCSGGPRANIYCGGDPTFCNPTGGTTYTCNDATNANGVPTPMLGSDDTCGDGTTDDWVRADWSVSTTSVRQRRNTDTSMLNGINAAGRYSGDIYYNNLEDFYGPAGKGWASEIGFIVQEPTGSTAAKFGYGAAVDDMVIEWQETHPVAQAVSSACDAGQAYFAANGQCAVLTLGQLFNTGSGDAEIPVTIVDAFPGTWPAGNLGECSISGTNGVQITAYSGVDLIGEKYCLLPTSVGSSEYGGSIKSTTRINVVGDGYVYAAYDGVRAPSVSVRYIDMQDGVAAHNFGPGPDGQPGIAGFDDNGDGTVDNAIEQCSDETSFAAGRSPHRPGTAARYSDDLCGCVNNPLLATIQNFFDVVDIIVSDVTVRDGTASLVGKGDADGYLDKKEEVVVDVKIRNLSDFPVEDLELTLSTSSSLIECMIDDRILVNRIEKALDPGSEIDTASGTDHFSFVVANGANRVNPGDDFASEFTVSVRGLAKASLATSFRVDLPIDGTAVVQTFKLPHNLNAPAATQTTDFVDTFETYTNDASLVCLPVAPATRCTTAPYVKRNTGDDATELQGTHCQINNPGNPFGNNTDTDDYCTVGEGYSNSENHWHLHAPNAPTGTTCERDQPSGNDCPDGGRGHRGDKSMGSGYFATYGFPLDNNWTMTWNRMFWLKTRDVYQLGVGKKVNGNTPVVCDTLPCSTGADQAPVLEYWTQMSQLDWRTFGDYPPWTFDSALTYLCVDKNANSDCDTAEDGLKDNTEKWEPLRAYYSPESSFKLNNFINCMYDPSDDGNTETDFFNGSTAVGPSSTCYPEASDSCVGRTDNEQPSNPYWSLSLGYPCWPETGVEGLEGELGNRGPGKWIKRLYSLKQWRGQKVLFRWHVAPGGLKGYQHCATGPGCGNLDDGWFIDDVRLYGRANSISLANDNTLTPVPGTCPGSPADTLVARVAAIPFPRNFADATPKPAVACSDTAVAYCDFNNDSVADASSSTGQADAPGRPFVLDARNSTATACRGGALEFRYEDGLGTLVRDWLTDPVTYVNPEYTTTYVLKMRCSSDTGGTPTISQANVTINTCVLKIKDLLVTKTGLTDAQLAWTSAVPWDVARGTLSTISTYAATCLANDQPGATTFNDATPASTSDGWWYVVRDNDGTWAEGYTCGIVGTRPINVSVCP